MLDFADVVAIKKFGRKGAQDALRDAAKQYRRNRELWGKGPDRSTAPRRRFNDDGVTALYHGLLPKLAELGLTLDQSKNPTRKVALPRYEDHGEVLRFLMRENMPGSFPYTAGEFAFKRENEDPTRMFAGTTRSPCNGADPALRPDMCRKVGNSGVSIATLDDMKVLYDGFDLCAPQPASR
jgi:hypothetical protein